MALREISCEVDETGSGLCSMTGFGISGDELSGSANSKLVNIVVWCIKAATAGRGHKNCN
jgi:hypothetical protein